MSSNRQLLTCDEICILRKCRGQTRLFESEMFPLIHENRHESHHSHLSENGVAQSPANLSNLDDT